MLITVFGPLRPSVGNTEVIFKGGMDTNIMGRDYFVIAGINIDHYRSGL
jgi:hypothetical protein